MTACFNDVSRPFGHELVIVCMLRGLAPWRTLTPLSDEALAVLDEVNRSNAAKHYLPPPSGKAVDIPAEAKRSIAERRAAQANAVAEGKDPKATTKTTSESKSKPKTFISAETTETQNKWETLATAVRSVIDKKLHWTLFENGTVIATKSLPHDYHARGSPGLEIGSAALKVLSFTNGEPTHPDNLNVDRHVVPVLPDHCVFVYRYYGAELEKGNELSVFYVERQNKQRGDVHAMKSCERNRLFDRESLVRIATCCDDSFSEHVLDMHPEEAARESLRS